MPLTVLCRVIHNVVSFGILKVHTKFPLNKVMRVEVYLAASSLNIFMGCLSSKANSSPPEQKSVIRQTCVGVWYMHQKYKLLSSFSYTKMELETKDSSIRIDKPERKYIK